ncbi:PREDICTED: uncharacterized protein LOC109483660 [Branchiostoma belcheri]|uniref:Uncharacterized protein LOC109483660 n=1 Tax=Branchiostoma belcheri TaxID=7741 RepID=A0A6P5A7M6_BRABE|nr:PREDICTED: uncharacterized protein LOC109483660 [Branchiostoma belcheri]
MVEEEHSYEKYLWKNTHFADYNGNWGEWSKWECTEPCKSGVKARRERYCDDPAPTPGHHCIGDEQGAQKQVEPAACEEYCAKEWSEWSEWSVCSMTCDAPVRKRIRDCLGIGAPCPGEKEEVKDCDQKWRHDPCPPQHGEWGLWGPWSPDCYPQCNEGLHTRHRDCDSPPPIGEGEYCEGEDEDTKECEVPEYMMNQCGAVAEWTKWGKWQQCTATCGRAMGFRVRQCKNPDGSLTNSCRGQDKQEAQCSLPPCSLLLEQGKPTEEQLKKQALEQLMEEEKAKIHHDITVETVADVKLPCKHVKTQMSPESAEWKKDGKSIEVEGKHLVLDKWDLTIRSTEVEDTGIYVCRRGDLKDRPIIYAVTVIPDKAKPPQIVKSEAHTKLPCKPGVLAILIKGATAVWKRDNKVIKKMDDLKSPSLVMTKPIVEDSGLYTCTVKDPETKRHYTTNRVQLKVVKANMMDKALGKALDIKSNNPAVFFGAIGGVVGFIVLVGIVCLILKRIQAKEVEEQPLSSDEEEKIGMIPQGSQSEESEGEEGPVDDKGEGGGEGTTEVAPEEEKGSGSDQNAEQKGDTDEGESDNEGDDDGDSDGGGSESGGSNGAGKDKDTGAESDDEGEESSEDDSDQT